MKEWIEKHLDPPGNERKNWRSLFSFIGRVFGIVKDDAVKAHNAHFPYLADEEKLEEHGQALAIPHLFYDKPDEYRNRVAAASFFLMKAWERGYIKNLLEERFGERYQVIEKFLQLQTKIAEITEEEKAWVLSLLDSLIDPVVSFEISEWFRHIENVLLHDSDEALYLIKCRDIDAFGGYKFHNGKYRHNGEIFHGSDTGIHDDFEADIKMFLTESVDISDQIKIGIRKHHFHDGAYRRDGSIAHDSMILIELE
jgi:hypothetical protein